MNRRINTTALTLIAALMLTGIIAATEQMTREERQKLGLDFEGDEPVPDFLQGSIPGLDGGLISTAGLTTFGTFSDLPGFGGKMLLPQLGAMSALEGIDWKGDRLVDSVGRPLDAVNRIKSALWGTAESAVPFLNVARSVLDRGGAGALPAREYPASTIDYLRGLSNSQQINVPISGSSTSAGGESNPWDAVDAQLEGAGSNPWDAVELP